MSMHIILTLMCLLDSVFVKNVASVDEVGIASKAFCLSFVEEVRSDVSSTELIFTQTHTVFASHLRDQRNNSVKMLLIPLTTAIKLSVNSLLLFTIIVGLLCQ